MAVQPKKKFPGIFIIIAISFIVYLTIVSILIYAHYIKKAPGQAPAKTAQSKS